ncbi:MAG: LytTR family transcriptional regulator [Pseudoflavonifractor sp.]|nr:LytTR family transcriptional regulator [Alloprevotella sp.]MCM1116139.1 LytTR family transcriptional regulator [Pseudoflavonifractor sp.]
MRKGLLFFTSTELVRVPAEAVVFISADGNYSAMTMADGSDYVLTLQLGQVEKRLAEMASEDDNRFIRIGKSLIVNREFITFITPARQKLILSDGRSFRHEVSASREALKALKDYIEKEETR